MIIIVRDFKPSTPFLELLTHELERDQDTNVADLDKQGWHYAEYPNTGYRVLVRPTDKTRMVDGVMFNELEARLVDTVPNSDCSGVCVALGDKLPNMYTNSANVWNYGGEVSF